MAESNDGGEVIYVQFPRQSTEADTPMSEQTDNEVAVEAAELEAYNFYRDKLQQEAQQLAVQDGAPIDVNPLEITIRFQEILKLEDAIKKSAELEIFFARIRAMLTELRMQTPIVVYAMTFSRHCGPDMYQLVRYEGLLQDVIMDTSYKNWDEVMNSDVDVDEETMNLPNDLYFSLIPAIQDKNGEWKQERGSLANDIPFSQVLAIRHHAKVPMWNPYTV